MPDHAGMDVDDERGTRVDARAVGDPADGHERSDGTAVDRPAGTEPKIDLDRIEADLADVEVALARLDSGEYWRDEVTGEDLPDTLLAERPTARRTSA